MDVGQPSRFWDALGREHAADLERYGLDSVKRHQALRYFSWQWRWRTLPQSVQMRFLLRHSRAGTVFRCVRTPVGGGDWSGVPWTRADRWLYAFAVRLLWEYASEHDALGVLGLEEPELGSPFPLRWQGRLISQDLANTALEGDAIARGLNGRRPTSILEVGAGYGRTAYALLCAFPDATYTVVDIEPALSISRWYLGRLFPAERLRFLRPEEALELDDGAADLVVSVSSLHEMTEAQLEEYLGMFDRVAAGGLVFLKQWRSWTNPADGITMAFERYPIPGGWERLFLETSPVQTGFQQAAWRVVP